MQGRPHAGPPTHPHPGAPHAARAYRHVEHPPDCVRTRALLPCYSPSSPPPHCHHHYGHPPTTEALAVPLSKAEEVLVHNESGIIALPDGERGSHHA